MPKRVEKDLTDVRVRNAKPAVAQYEIFDRSVGGFALRVAPSGHKSYVVNYRCNGKSRRMTLGNATVMQLAEAREAAMIAKAQAKSGIDPLEEKRRLHDAEKRKRQIEILSDERTFAAVAGLYIQRYAKGKGATPNKKTWQTDERILQKYVIPKWGARQIDDLGRSDVVTLLDSVEDNHGLYMANRTLAVVRKLFNWGLVERALVEVTPIVPGMARKGEKKRSRVLNDDEIAAFWNATKSLGYPFGPLFRILLATGQRRDEVTQMKWSDIDVKRSLWTIPSVGTKADRGDHAVPLNSATRLIIDALPVFDGQDLLFSTAPGSMRAVSGFSKAKSRCDRLMRPMLGPDISQSGILEWRLHDLRRTMATIMEAELKVPPHIVGAILNHDPKSFKGVTATYTVSSLIDERREALEAWSQKLLSITKPK